MERVKQGLSEAGLLPEEWGGQTPMVAVSAPTCLICSGTQGFYLMNKGLARLF